MTVDNYRRLRTDRGEQGAEKLNPGLWGKDVEAADPVAATPEGGKPNAENHLVEAPAAEEAEPEAEAPEVPSEPEEPTVEPEAEEPAEEPSEEPSAEDEPEA